MATASVEGWFERARKHAAPGNLAVVREDGQCLVLPALAKDSVRPEMIAAVERLLPPAKKRNVAIIGDTSWASSGAPSLQAANAAIPFFGLLMGFATIGHAVWVFNGAGDSLTAGCREADVLIVDSASVAALPVGWQTDVRSVMRIPKIWIHDRASYKLLPQE